MERRKLSLNLTTTWAQEAGPGQRPTSNRQKTLYSLQLFAGPPVRAILKVDGFCEWVRK